MRGFALWSGGCPALPPDYDGAMDQRKPAPRILEYVAGPIYLHGEYRQSSMHGILRAGGFLVAGVVALLGPGRITRSVAGDWVHHLDVYLFRAAAIACFVVCLYRVWCIVAGRRWEVRITQDGITRKGQFHPWEEIASFGGTTAGWLVEIRFRRRAGLQSSDRLELTPQLTVEEYRVLARHLNREVGRRHPHLQIGLEPASEPST